MMNPVAMDAARHHVLQKYHISPEERLSSGMEAEVYAYGLNAVLKLYTGTTTLADLHILQDFYNSLDRQHLPYALPRIYTVAQEDRFLITIEQWLAGMPMSTVLPNRACRSCGTGSASMILPHCTLATHEPNLLRARWAVPRSSFPHIPSPRCHQSKNLFSQ